MAVWEKRGEREQEREEERKRERGKKSRSSASGRPIATFPPFFVPTIVYPTTLEKETSEEEEKVRLVEMIR